MKMPYFFVFMAKSDDWKAAYSLSLQLIEASNNGVLFCIGMPVLWIASFLAMTRSDNKGSASLRSRLFEAGVGAKPRGFCLLHCNDAKRAWGRSPEGLRYAIITRRLSIGGGGVWVAPSGLRVRVVLRSDCRLAPDCRFAHGLPLRVIARRHDEAIQG